MVEWRPQLQACYPFQFLVAYLAITMKLHFLNLRPLIHDENQFQASITALDKQKLFSDIRVEQEEPDSSDGES